MKKKYVMILFVAMVWSVLFSSQSYAASAPNIAYVDLSRLFDEYHKTKSYDKELEEKHRSLEKEAKEKVEKIKELNGRKALLNDDKKAEIDEELEALKADLMEFDRQSKTSLTKERNEKIREILLEIEKIVSNFAEKNKYDIILNDRVLIYGSPSIEVTEQILEILNDDAE
ncbi:MAG: OmpH family outer membrane protein [Candidatus Omnitrophica bacterium]|nr:OmpH family outer membrane protein [Candidatus Omnitrophota bacterium]